LINQGEPLFDAYTNSVVPSFTTPIGRVVSDMLLVPGLLPAKSSVEASLGLPKEREIKTVSFSSISTSFIAP